MHRLLQRQIRRYLGSVEDIPQELQRLVDAVSAAYQQSDDDRALLERSLELTSQELIDRNEQLRQRREELELLVGERTADLEIRTIQLQTAAEVARDATRARDLNELLNQAVDLIHERFGFHHTAFYLLDELNNSLILMAAAGKAGQEMLADTYRHDVNEDTLFGQAVINAEPRINFEPEEVDNLLPDSRSEVVLPLRIGERIIGVINVHSLQEAAFDEEIISILQVLADQLAVAISNTQLLQEMEHTLRELETATGRYTKDAWQKVGQRTDRPIGYRSRGVGIEPIHHVPEETDEVTTTSQVADQASIETGEKLSVPIRMRDQTIGTLSLRITEGTLPETTALAESVAERMSLALENARLLEETQSRAEQERLLARISTRVRETLDVDSVLKNAVNEIREALELHDVMILLETMDETSQIEQRTST